MHVVQPTHALAQLAVVNSLFLIFSQLVQVGPAWDCDPPQLTVAIRHMQSESRFSGMKHTMVYEVETEQLGTRVARRYRHFLWLYDKMAELFPCLSLPPLPVKHFSGEKKNSVLCREERGGEEGSGCVCLGRGKKKKKKEHPPRDTNPQPVT